MSEVTRYSAQPFSPNGLMFKNEFGHYVLFCEYEKLKAENIRLTKAYEEMYAQLTNYLNDPENKVQNENEWLRCQLRNERDDYLNEHKQVINLTRQRDIMKKALEFYAANKGLRINFKSNNFESSDSDGKDFHGAVARKALQEAEQIK